MEAELRANDHKPGWKGDRSLDLAYRAREEADELRDLIWDTKSWTLTPAQLDEPGRHGLKSLRQRIASEAADVGNMAMMAADVTGALPMATTGEGRAIDLDRIAISLAKMLTEYVEGGINANQNWRNGLAEIIQARLRRLLPASLALQPMASAPLDRTIILITSCGYVVKAKWERTGFTTAELQDSGAWVAAEESQHPPCWSDGACWASNANECESDQPIGWLPMPEIAGAVP